MRAKGSDEGLTHDTSALSHHVSLPWSTCSWQPAAWAGPGRVWMWSEVWLWVCWSAWPRFGRWHLVPFTPKSHQRQISPSASPKILHHTLWRTWLFIAYQDEIWLCYQFSLHHLYITLRNGWENVHCKLSSERVIVTNCAVPLASEQCRHSSNTCRTWKGGTPWTSCSCTSRLSNTTPSCPPRKYRRRSRPPTSSSENLIIRNRAGGGAGGWRGGGGGRVQSPLRNVVHKVSFLENLWPLNVPIRDDEISQKHGITNVLKHLH